MSAPAAPIPAPAPPAQKSAELADIEKWMAEQGVN
jgi:hypothetical protein